MKFTPYALCLAALLLTMPAMAAEEEKPIGYGGAMVELNPMMVPYKMGGRVQYHVVTLRLILDVGLNERPACFMTPVVHEKFLLYLNKTMPGPSDFVGQRRDVMEKTLLDIATDTTDRGYYSGVKVVDELSPPLMSDPKSKTLSTQCH